MGCNTQLESSRCHQTQCISGFLIATSAFSTVLLCILNWHHACNPRFPQLSEVEKTCNRLRRIEVVMHRMFFRYLNVPACRGHHAASACSWSWLSAVSASGASKAHLLPHLSCNNFSLNMSASIFRAFGQTTPSSPAARGNTRKRMPIHRGTYSFVNRQSGTAMELTSDHTIVG